MSAASADNDDGDHENENENARLPRLVGRTDEELERAVDAAFATVGEPVRSAALFYALYYLARVEGIEAAEFDFQREVDRQVRGFWWYGTYALASEFSNADSRYFIVGMPVGSAAETDVQAGKSPQRASPDDIGRHTAVELFPDNPAMADLARDLLLDVFALRQHAVGRDLPGVVGTFAWIRERLEAHPNLDRPWAGVCRDLFDAMGEPRGGPDIMQEESLTGWAIGYDGPAWVEIGDHLLRRAELPEVAWVDLAWAIEHNNRAWIDKIEVDLSDVEAQAIQDLGATHRLQAVRDILDANQAGDMARVFDWAVRFNAEVGIDFRRFHRRLRGPLDPPAPWRLDEVTDTTITWTRPGLAVTPPATMPREGEVLGEAQTFVDARRGRADRWFVRVRWEWGDNRETSRRGEFTVGDTRQKAIDRAFELMGQ